MWTHWWLQFVEACWPEEGWRVLFWRDRGALTRPVKCQSSGLGFGCQLCRAEFISQGLSEVNKRQSKMQSWKITRQSALIQYKVWRSCTLSEYFHFKAARYIIARRYMFILKVQCATFSVWQPPKFLLQCEDRVRWGTQLYRLNQWFQNFATLAACKCPHIVIADEIT